MRVASIESTKYSLLYWGKRIFWNTLYICKHTFEHCTYSSMSISDSIRIGLLLHYETNTLLMGVYFVLVVMYVLSRYCCKVYLLLHTHTNIYNFFSKFHRLDKFFHHRYFDYLCLVLVELVVKLTSRLVDLNSPH